MELVKTALELAKTALELAKTALGLAKTALGLARTALGCHCVGLTLRRLRWAQARSRQGAVDPRTTSSGAR